MCGARGAGQDRPSKGIRAANQGASVKTQTLFGYDDTNRVINTSSDKDNFGDSALINRTVYDGLGRVSQTQLASDPQGTVSTDIFYDPLGRKQSESNPHRSGETAYYASYEYDALSRVKKITKQDNQYATTDYLGNCSTNTDEAGKKRKSCSDALGRLTAVWEDPNGLNYETDYRYDALGNLTRVIQSGLQDRQFAYDSLSRLLKAYNPEGGWTCYGVWSGNDCVNGYDANGNLLRKTDARGVTTTFAYDSLNRLLSKQYSDGTPSGCFQHDQTSLAPGAPNLIGRMTNEWRQPGTCPAAPPASGIKTERSILAYDALGRTKQEQQCTPFNCNGAGTPSPLNYGYDLAGNLTQSTNGMTASPAVTLTYGFDTASHLRTVTSSWNDANHPATLYSATPWSPLGVTDFALGSSVQVHRDYNQRTWLYNQTVQGNLVSASTPGTTTFSISFSEQGQDTPATGSVTVGGSEQSKQVLSQSAAPGSVGITVTGAERSTQITVQNATQATGYVTISGSSQTRKYVDPDTGEWFYVTNFGYVYVTVNGFTKSAYYSYSNNTAAILASALASAFNADGNSPVTAYASGSTVYLTSKATGSAANYSLSTSCDYASEYGFSTCSFTGTRSGANLTGGQDAIINTVYDTGTVSLTVNGFGKSVGYGQGSSGSSVASDLANAFNGDGNSPVTAGLSGSTIIVTAKQSGAGTNYGFSTSSGTNSGYFSGSSFGTSPGSGALSGGRDASYYTVYDSGAVSVSVNGYNKSASYGQSSTASALASTIASAFTNDGSSPVTASANGGTISFTTRQAGSGVNYPLSAGVSYDSGNFTQASFSATPSGGTLTGGVTNGIHDAGTVTMAVNSPAFSKTVSYGNGDTASSLASRLASAYAGDSNSPVNVSANGSALTVTSKQTGAGTNYGLTLSQTHDTAHFSSPSFTGPATATLSGGVDSSLYPGSIYSFNISSFQPNGNIQTVADGVTGTWTYGYDALNRLTAGSSSAGLCAGMNISWGYDRFGNRTNQSASGSSGCSIVQPTFSFSGGNNRIDGWSYDAAGNVLNDGVHQYTYDAENRISTVLDLGTQYIYDAEGRRAAKANASTGALLANYILGLGGEQITELNGAGQWVHSNVSAGSLMATYDNVGTHFHVSDWLGTRRVQAGVNGAMQGSYFSYPFGDGLATSGTDATEHHFTGKERDTESGMDYFGARYYGSTMGRFLSPDVHPSALNNPQTLNKYSYVFDNPLRLVDPDGHFPTESHIAWSTNALSSFGFHNASTFASAVNKAVDYRHVLDNFIHGMSGAEAYRGARFGLLSIAANPGLGGSGQAAVALVMGMHLVQDYQAHQGLHGIIEHFLKFGFSDADPKSAAGEKAQSETTRFLRDFRAMLVANFGEDGAKEAMGRIVEAAEGLTEEGISKQVDQLSNELQRTTPPSVVGLGSLNPTVIRGTNIIQENAKRQCINGNPAACD